MRRRPETQIRLGIKKFLKEVGFYVIDTEQNRRTRVTPGLSDLIAFGHGVVLFVEVKTEKGKLSAYQEEFGGAVSQNGGNFLVWRSTHDAWDYLVQVGVIEEAV